MSTPMPERMSVIETKVAQIETDVVEIKKDVKTLLAANQKGVGSIDFLARVVPWLALLVAGAVAFHNMMPPF